MRTLWIFFSVLVSAAVVAVYVMHPIDPLQWVAEMIFGAGAMRLPPAGPVTRVADAALAGAVVVYLLIFIPLSAATWLDGGRQSRAFRRAQAAASDTPGERAASGGDTSSSWWPLLAPYGRYGGRGADMDDARSVSKSGRAAIIDNLVANQSAASVFRDFPVIAIGLGLIALIGQLLPVLAADPAAVVGGSSSALGNATARGFCSLIASVVAAALFGLLSQLVGAVLRKRAESISGAAALAIRQRRWNVVEPAERRPIQPSLLVTPLPQSDAPRRLDVEDKLIEHGAARGSAISAEAGRAFAETVEKAIRDIQVNTLRPMLHDISRLLSLLGERAGNLVENVDDRLTRQAEQSQQMLAAAQENARLLSLLGERAGNLAETVGERLNQQVEQSRQVLTAGQETTRLLAELGEQAGHLVANVDERSRAQGEQSRQALAASQEGARLLTALGERVGRLAESVDDRLTQQTEQSRQILAAGQEISRLLTVLADRPAAIAATQDTGRLPGVDAAALQELRRSLSEGLAGAIGQAAERIDGSAAAMTRIGMLLESASGTIDQKLDRLVAAQEARPATPAAANGQLPAETVEEVASVARAAREALDAIAALSQQLRSEAPRPGAYSPMVDSDPHSWAQRVSALHRLSISSTSGLPALDSAGLAQIGTGLADAPDYPAEDAPSGGGTMDEPKPGS